MIFSYPKVTIIMATYNRAHFIVETLMSIQKQTYTNWECLLIDDGGSDNTKEVIKPFIDNDHRFQYVKRPNSYKKGLPGCRNYGLDLAKGDYIIFFDDDDIVHPQNLEICIKELEANEYQFCRYNRAVFTGDFNYRFDDNDKYNRFKIGVKDLEKIIDGRLPFNSCAVMWVKQCFKNKRFIETLMYAEEWELYSRLLSTGIRGISIEKCLFYGRKHINSNTGEFYNNSPVRIQSNKEAIHLVTQNLVSKNLLSLNLFKYLLGLAISFRDKKLVRYILTTSNVALDKKVFAHIKYWLFPLWKVYKRLIKKIK